MIYSIKDWTIRPSTRSRWSNSDLKKGGKIKPVFFLEPMILKKENGSPTGSHHLPMFKLFFRSI